MTDPVAWWQERLAARVGAGPAELERLRAELLGYCDRHGVTPEELLKTWTGHPDLTVRRRPGSAETPNRAAESFLIHNGINVFGDIVCVAGRADDLARQGPWFTREDR